MKHETSGFLGGVGVGGPDDSNPTNEGLVLFETRFIACPIKAIHELAIDWRRMENPYQFLKIRLYAHACGITLSVGNLGKCRSRS